MYCFFLPRSLSESECESESDSVWVWVSQRNYPKTIYQMISEELHIPNKNSEHKICTKNRWREITAKKSLQRNLYPKSQKNNYRPNKLWRDISSKKNLTEEKKYQEIFEEKSLPKNIGKNLYGRISKETFPAKRLGRRISTKKIWRPYSYQNAFESISCKNSLKRNPCQTNFNRNLYQKKYWTKHVHHKLSEEKSAQSNFQKKPPQKNEQIHQKYLIKHLYQKTVEGPEKNYVKFYPNISEEKFSTEQSVKGNSQPNKFCRKVSSKQIPKETSTKEYLRKHAYQT